MIECPKPIGETGCCSSHFGGDEIGAVSSSEKEWEGVKDPQVRKAIEEILKAFDESNKNPEIQDINTIIKREDLVIHQKLIKKYFDENPNCCSDESKMRFGLYKKPPSSSNTSRSTGSPSSTGSTISDPIAPTYFQKHRSEYLKNNYPNISFSPPPLLQDLDSSDSITIVCQDRFRRKGTVIVNQRIGKGSVASVGSDK